MIKAAFLATAMLALPLGGSFLVSLATVSPAEAVVCARGVYRAGCAGPRGAVATRRPVYRRPVYRAPRRAVIVR